MVQGTVIARGGLNLRRTPKTGKIRRTLRRGSKVTVLEEETWLRVRTRAGDEGYVLADHIELEPDDIPDAAVVQQAAPMPLGTPEESEDGQCIIERYANTHFIGRELRADRDFFSSLDRLNGFARTCDVEIFVTSSTREPGRTVSGAIVTPASRSNHLVGHAIDMNLKSKSGFYNSKLLKKSNHSKLPKEIREFLNMVRRDDVLRWGGDFNREDPVHIDDSLNNRYPELWESKFASRA